MRFFQISKNFVLAEDPKKKFHIFGSKACFVDIFFFCDYGYAQWWVLSVLLTDTNWSTAFKTENFRFLSKNRVLGR